MLELCRREQAKSPVKPEKFPRIRQIDRWIYVRAKGIVRSRARVSRAGMGKGPSREKGAARSKRAYRWLYVHARRDGDVIECRQR